MVFLEEMPRRMAELRAALVSGDSTGLQAAAHTLKGSAATLGFEDVAHSALEIERRAPDGAVDRNELSTEIDRLAVACEAVSAALRKYLENER